MASPTKSSRLFSRWVSPLAEDNSSAQCSPETSPSTSGTPRPFGGVLQTPTIVTDSSPTESASTPIPSHDFITSFLTTTWYEGIVDKSAASTVAHRSPTPHSVTPSPPPPLRERTTTAVTPSHDCRFTYRGASPPTKPWSSFHTAESNTGEDELLVEVTRPWLHYADPPRPVSFTPRVTKPTQSPFKLEPLGPLRRHSNKVLPSKTYISETPRLPYAQVAGSDAPEMAEILALPPRTTVSKRNEKNYQNLIREAASSGNPGTAEAYLKSMMLDAASGLTPSPDGRCYNHVMHAYAQAGNPEDAQKIMDLMWENAMFSEGPLPNKKLYTNLLHAWQKSSDKYRAPEECENILRQMYRLHNSDKAPQCKPDIFTYTCILHCWADSKRSDAVRRADKLFDEMMLRYGNGETDLAPDRVCYSNLINVYINSQDNDFSDIGTIVKAEGRFWEMVDLFFAGNKKAEPSTRNFNTILAALSNCTSSKAALHASEMILKWEKLNQEGKLREEPDSYSYSLLLKSWSNSPRKDAMEKLESTVDHLRYVAQRINPTARLDAVKYGTVIVAFTKNKYAQKAHNLLMEMASTYQETMIEDTRPEIKTFQSVMTAWTRHPNAIHAADQADALLARLESLYSFDKRCKPNVYVYNSLLFCFKNAGQARRAHTLLSELKRKAIVYHFDGPNETSYHATLDAWDESPDPILKLQMIRRLKAEYRARFHHDPPSRY